MTGYQSKKAAAQAKLVVTDIDGHIVRDVRKPKKAAAQDKMAQPAQRQWVGLTAEQIASIPLNEYTLQTAERLLKDNNA